MATAVKKKFLYILVVYTEITHSVSISLFIAPVTDGLDMHAFLQKTNRDNGQQHSSLSVLFNCSIYHPITPGHHGVTGLDAQQKHPVIFDVGCLKNTFESGLARILN